MAFQISKQSDEEEQLEIIQMNFTPAVISCMGKHVFAHFRRHLSMESQVEEELSKKVETESKKTSGQYSGKKTAAPAVNQLSLFQKSPFQQQSYQQQKKP